MTKTTKILLALVAAAACSSGPPRTATAPQQQPAAQPWVSTPPVYALVGEREKIKLTSAQVTALDSIGQALQGQNSPLIKQVTEIQATSGRRRPDARQVEQSRPLLDRIRENNRRAHEAVAAVLTAEQETTICELYRQGDATETARRRRAEAQRSMGTRRPGTMMDTTLLAARTPWSWCNPQRAGTRAPGAAADTARRDTAAARP